MKKISVLLFLFAAVLVGGYTYWSLGNLPADANDESQKIFIIRKGATVREIGNSLKRENLIRDPVVFFMYIKLNNKDRSLQAGDYRLSPSMSLKNVIDTLNHGILDIWVTIPEGYRAEEIADVLEKDVPSYKPSWRKELAAQEGYLFPDTYLIPRDADVNLVVSVMKNNFYRKVAELNLDENSPTLPRIVTIASLIEREAVTDEEKPLISGILANRMSLGMPLQVDATVQYAKGYNTSQKKWWPQITVEDYKSVDSSYNTYLVTGLPPGPISNPGIMALRAAQNPLDTDYLYYIHDSKGRIHPAKTVQEHNANVDKYL